MFIYQFQINVNKVVGIGFVQNLQGPQGNVQTEFITTNSVDVPIAIRSKEK